MSKTENVKTILYGNEHMEMDKEGQITRPSINMAEPSGQWKITGAVRMNNFGHIVDRVSLKDILSGIIKDWQYKNGKQKWHVTDLDHGTHRIWGCPNHSIY